MSGVFSLTIVVVEILILLNIRDDIIFTELLFAVLDTFHSLLMNSLPFRLLLLLQIPLPFC